MLVKRLGRVAYYVTTLFFIIILFFLIIFYFFDNDFDMTLHSLINVIITLVFVYVGLMLLVLYENIKSKRILDKQIDVLDNQPYVIDELKESALVNKQFSINQDLKRRMFEMNEEQERWVHDIKIPLATLKLFIDNNKSKLSKEDLRVLEEVYLGIQEDINNKVMLDKIELEIDDMKIEKIDLESIVSKVIKEHKSQFMFKKMSVDIDLKDTFIHSDERTWYYVFSQLISNALKFGESHSVLKIYDDSKHIYVQSQGDPLSESDAKRIFDKGFTGANSINKGVASTGFGLYMVKKALNHLEDDISVEVDNNITRFKITM